MWCPACGRHTPDAHSECKHCGVPVRPSMLRRLLGMFRAAPEAGRAAAPGATPARARPSLRPDEQPAAVEMPAAAAKPVPFSAHRVTDGDQEALDALSPELRETVRRSLREARGPAAAAGSLQRGTI